MRAPRPAYLTVFLIIGLIYFSYGFCLNIYYAAKSLLDFGASPTFNIVLLTNFFISIAAIVLTALMFTRQSWIRIAFIVLYLIVLALHITNIIRMMPYYHMMPDLTVLIPMFIFMGIASIVYISIIIVAFLPGSNQYFSKTQIDSVKNTP